MPGADIIYRSGQFKPQRSLTNEAKLVVRCAPAKGPGFHGLQGCSRRRYRQRRPGDAEHPRRARVSGRRGPCGRLAPVARHRGVVRRPDAQVQGPRTGRFPRAGLLPDVGGLGGVEGVVAEDRRHRLSGHRQFFVLALRARHSAGGAGGECARAAGVHGEERPAQHHRQSQLLYRPARRRPEAPARRGAHTPRGRGDLPVGVGRRQGGHG